MVFSQNRGMADDGQQGEIGSRQYSTLLHAINAA